MWREHNNVERTKHVERNTRVERTQHVGQPFASSGGVGNWHWGVQLCASQLWQMADVHICTAIREAVNIWPLEYVFCRDLARLAPGALILSEFTGFARVLNGALRVNPFSQTQLGERRDDPNHFHLSACNVPASRVHIACSTRSLARP